MNLYKQSQHLGVDLANSNILRDPKNARDALNVLIDSDNKNTIIKRPGSATVATTTDLVDMTKYQRGNKNVYLKEDGLYDSDVTTKITLGGTNPPNNYSVPSSNVEMSGCKYFADPSLANGIWKYDGSRFYAAGVPALRNFSVSSSTLTFYTWATDMIWFVGSVIKDTGSGLFYRANETFYADPAMTVASAVTQGLLTQVTLPTNTTYYFRLAYVYMDNQGNFHWGDYKQSSLAGQVFDFTIPAYGACNFLSQAYAEAYCNFEILGGISSLRFPVVDTTTYQVGDRIWVISGDDSYSLPIVGKNTGVLPTTWATGVPYVKNQIIYDDIGLLYYYVKADYTSGANAGVDVANGDLISAGFGLGAAFTELLVDTREFTSVTLGDLSLPISAATTYLFSNYAVGIFMSLSPEWGYSIASGNWIQPLKLEAGGNLPENLMYNGGNQAMEELYDPNVVRSLPPVAKYISSYGGLMLAANISQPTNVMGDTFNNSIKVKWSDLANGCSVENFPPFNEEIIGNTEEGELTGIFGASTRITIFKTYQVYYMEGTLIAGQYRLYSSLSNGIGCVAHRSIVEAEGGTVFLSAKGVQLAGGGKPIALSSDITPFFTRNNLGSQFDACLAINFIASDLLLFFIPSSVAGNDRIVVFDYDFKTWFFWSGWDCRAGFLYNKTAQGQAFFGNSTTIKSTNDTFVDDSAPIQGKYITGWIHNNNPGLKKKWVKLVVHSLNNTVWNLTVNMYKDWNTTTPEATTTKTFGNGVCTVDVMLPLSNAKAISLELICNTAEGMGITGIEVEFNEGQTRVYGDVI